MIDVLKTESDLKTIIERVQTSVAAASHGAAENSKVFQYIQTLEAMLVDGWVIGIKNKSRPMLTLESGGRMIRSAKEGRKAIEESGVSSKFFTIDE
jgi:hypothetical protein